MFAPRPLRARLRGQVDHANDRIVRGWAWFPLDPNRRALLDVFYRDIYLGQVSAGGFRADLLEHGIGDGHHAFLFHLPDDVDDETFEASSLTVVSAGPDRAIVPLSLDIAPRRLSRKRFTTDYRTTLKPFVLSLSTQRHLDHSRIAQGRRRHIDVICAANTGRPESAFIDHIAIKTPSLRSAGPAAIDPWQWYLETYASECGPRLAPLSKTDIEHLRAYADRWIATSKDDSADARYLWSIEESHRLFVEDCLVPDDHAAWLRSVDEPDIADQYPLSRFMSITRQRIAVLKRVRIKSLPDRRRFYVLMMVLAVRSPHFLTYLPKAWVQRLLADGGDFETTVIDLFGAGASISSGRFKDLIAESGFDLESATFAGRRYEGHRVLGGPTIVTTPSTVDVQIFGPFSRRLGLGESCRRIGRALASAPISINFVDHKLGHRASDVEFGLPFGRARSARLNILHLNLEEIPEAMAFLPDVSAGAPTVAIPYWELNAPSAVHRLGLSLVDEVWATSEYLKDVFTGAAAVVRFIGMSADDAAVPTIAERNALRSRYRFGPDTFVFLTSFDALSWAQRKNPLGAIQAFGAAFTNRENVALVVKTHNRRGLMTPAQVAYWLRVDADIASDSRITIIDDSFDAKEQRTLLAACDCLVSLHRAEGLGLDMIDALDLGTPLVATAYSGNMDFCSDDNTWLVPYKLQPVRATDYVFVEHGHVWAEPDVRAASEAMRSVFFDPRTRLERSKRGRHFTTREATTASLSKRLMTCIEAVRARGFRLDSTS